MTWARVAWATSSVQSGDEGADGVVELQLAPFAQQHEACGGEALRVRGDAEAVTRR